MTHPHGDGQAAVDVSFVKPPLLHDASSLRAQRGRVLAGTVTSQKHKQINVLQNDLGEDQVNSDADCETKKKEKNKSTEI